MILKSPNSYPLWDGPPDQQTLPLKPGTKNKQSELWLAVHLPRLALEIVTTDSHSKSLVIVKEAGNRQFVYLASHAAERLGIVSGMSLSAACALCADLHVHHINPGACQQALKDLELWALKFSPRVNLHPPCSLLLEIKGSIQYFGGLDNIKNQIVQTLRNRWGHEISLAVSPAPAASILLATSGADVVVNDINDLRSALGHLPIALLPLDEKRKRQLAKTGVRILRDLWRLPAAALARRFGSDLVYCLDRSLGKLAHPLSLYQPPPRFEHTYDISYEVDNYQSLLPYAYKLLLNLCRFLHKHDVYTSHYIFYFKHAQHTPTVINIDLRQPRRDPEHFLMLLETKISQMAPAGRVSAIKLSAETFHAYTTYTADMFPTQDIKEKTEQNIEQLLEQLYARLGHDMIRGIKCHEDHRPEYAYRCSEAGINTHTQVTGSRPFWLFPEPERLLKKNNRLYYKSAIRLAMGPERIEAGWWNGKDIHRDYYIAIDKLAGNLWIYHDLTDRRLWYLHGLFG